jgi:hypothetical protein
VEQEYSSSGLCFASDFLMMFSFLALFFLWKKRMEREGKMLLICERKIKSVGMKCEPAVFPTIFPVAFVLHVFFRIVEIAFRTTSADLSSTGHRFPVRWLVSCLGTLLCTCSFSSGLSDIDGRRNWLFWNHLLLFSIFSNQSTGFLGYFLLQLILD